MAGQEQKVAIPITAMLDMSFQLLFFFILNYHPSALEGQIEMALPSGAPGVVEQPQNPVIPAAQELVLPVDVTVNVRAVRDGGPTHGTISQVTVQGRTGEIVMPSLDALTEHLEKTKDRLDNREDVTIVADSGLRWSEVMKVTDACRKARFRTGFGAPPDLNVGQ
jgi:biopolymer transport protein ExbD